MSIFLFILFLFLHFFHVWIFLIVLTFTTYSRPTFSKRLFKCLTKCFLRMAKHRLNFGDIRCEIEPGLGTRIVLWNLYLGRSWGICRDPIHPVRIHDCRLSFYLTIHKMGGYASSNNFGHRSKFTAFFCWNPALQLIEMLGSDSIYNSSNPTQCSGEATPSNFDIHNYHSTYKACGIDLVTFNIKQ